MFSIPGYQHRNDQCAVIDSTVTVVRLNHSAQRIVCLSSSGLDVLSELGLEPVAALKGGVADCSEFYGKQSQQWLDTGSWLLPDIRVIRQAEPDLIVGWQFPHRFYRWQLARIAPVYLMGGSGYEEAIRRLLDIACLTGQLALAEAAISTLSFAEKGNNPRMTEKIKDRRVERCKEYGGD